MLKALYHLLRSPGALRHIKRHAFNPRWFIRNIKRLLQSSRPDALLGNIVNQFDDTGNYSRWIDVNEHFDQADLRKLREQIEGFGYRPHFSILVPTVGMKG